MCIKNESDAICKNLHNKKWITDVIKDYVEGTTNTLTALKYALESAENGNYPECFYSLEEINFYKDEYDFMIELEREILDKNSKP